MAKAVPSAKQLEWADLETGVLIHYLMDIYNPGYEGYKTKGVRTEMPPSIFRPSRLDPEQWVRSAYEMGAKYAVLVANHCTGFSLWQTKVNDYSCASIEWKNGKGDILREFIDACVKYGIKPGIYYSTGCNGYYDINDEEEQDYFSEKNREYVRCVEAQLTELWSEYGELFEVWFDGGIVPKEQGGPDVQALLKKYQPDAVTFQGPNGYKNNLRWVGNEDGCAPENCWGAYTPGTDMPLTGDPFGQYWMPAETDFPNRDNKRAFGGGWGWKEGEADTALSDKQLLDCYVNSVGRNTNMLIGMGIATDGQFEDEEQFIRFGRLLKKTFGTPVVSKKEIKGEKVTLINEKKCPLAYLVLCEDITKGHTVLKYKVTADGEEIYAGECIGHKRIIPLDGITPETVEVTVTEKDGDVTFRSAELF